MKKITRLLILICAIFIVTNYTASYYSTKDNITNTFKTLGYTIKLDSSDGTYSDNNIVIKNNKVILPTPTREGYTFLGYSDSIDGDVEYLPNSEVNVGDINNIVLYPIWYEDNVLVEYTISYNLNGGSISTTNPTKFTKNDEFALNNPTKSGYTFLGWTGSNGTTPQKSVIVNKGTTGNLNYTANWEEIPIVRYIVTFDPTDGYLSTSQKTRSVVSGNTIGTLPTPTSPSGYVFLGWATTKTGSTYISSTTTITSNKTYYAKYGEIYYIDYDLDGGILENAVEEFSASDSSFKLGTPTKDGYTFLGWTGSNGTTPQKSITIRPTSSTYKKDLSYTANWSRNDQIIYNRGNEYTSYTGGWDVVVNQERGLATKYSTYFWLSYTGLNESSSSAYTISKNVDLKDFDKVCATFSVIKFDATDGWTMMILEKPNYKEGIKNETTGTKNECFDISSYDKGRVQLTTTDMEARITKVWLTNK